MGQPEFNFGKDPENDPIVLKVDEEEIIIYPLLCPSGSW
jgi:hypothetical protein